MHVDLSPEMLAFAARVGHSRRLSTESRRTNNRNRGQNGSTGMSGRAKNRDRGYSKNVAVDLIGSMGELVAFKYFKQYMSPTSQAAFRQDIFSFAGGKAMKGADLIFDNLADAQLRLDVKTYECAPNKRFFAINSVKHRQLSGQCNGYLCILFQMYGKVAYVVNYVPHQDVTDWECKALGNYGDPSHNIPINKFAAQYAHPSLIPELPRLGQNSREEIHECIHSEKLRNDFSRFVVNNNHQQLLS